MTRKLGKIKRKSSPGIQRAAWFDDVRRWTFDRLLAARWSSHWHIVLDRDRHCSKIITTFQRLAKTARDNNYLLTSFCVIANYYFFLAKFNYPSSLMLRAWIIQNRLMFVLKEREIKLMSIVCTVSEYEHKNGIVSHNKRAGFIYIYRRQNNSLKLSRARSAVKTTVLHTCTKTEYRKQLLRSQRPVI